MVFSYEHTFIFFLSDHLCLKVNSTSSPPLSTGRPLTTMPSAAAVRCHYDILGIDKTADDTTIKKAYRKMALTWHPVRFSSFVSHSFVNSQSQPGTPSSHLAIPLSTVFYMSRIRTRIVKKRPRRSSRRSATPMRCYRTLTSGRGTILTGSKSFGPVPDTRRETRAEPDGPASFP